MILVGTCRSVVALTIYNVHCMYYIPCFVLFVFVWEENHLQERYLVYRMVLIAVHINVNNTTTYKISKLLFCYVGYVKLCSCKKDISCFTKNTHNLHIYQGHGGF